MKILQILPEDQDIKLQDDALEQAEQGDGNAGSQDEEGFMKSVMEVDDKEIEDGKLVFDMLNQGMSSFQPDLAMDQMKQNYQNVDKIFGESLISEATGYGKSTIERNIKLPEFQREMRSRLHAKSLQMQQDGLISRTGEILAKGIALATLSLYMNELDHLEASGQLGEHDHTEISHYGQRTQSEPYKKGARYRDVAVQDSIKKAIRRGHTKLTVSDLQISKRESRGEICIMYGIDASGSMRGKKIEMAKRAGVALAYKATQNKDKVGLMVFSDYVNCQVEPTSDMFPILAALTEIKASKQTDIAGTIEEAIKLFPDRKCTKHLILLTDAESTVGENPQEEAYKQAAIAVEAGVSVTIVGIGVDDKTAAFSRRLAEIGDGKCYIVDQVSELDAILLYDYDTIK